jgi:type IV pilus assembly protein PilO
MAMQLSLDKLPWHGQLGALALVCLGAVGSFYYFYAQNLYTDIATRETRLAGLRTDAARGQAIARRLPEFQAQVAELEQRLQALQAVLPDQKDVAEILRRLQGLATESNLSIQRFTPQPSVQQAMYSEVPFKIQAEGTYHNLGAFFDRISRFPRIINISNITIKAKPKQEANATIVAECVATTFVLQDAGKGKAGAKLPAATK